MSDADAPCAKRCRRSDASDWLRADAFAHVLASVSAPPHTRTLLGTDAAPDTPPSPVDRPPGSTVSRNAQEAIRRDCARLVKQIDSSESRPQGGAMVDETRYRRSPPPVPRRKWSPFSMKVRRLFRGACIDTPWPDPRLAWLVEKLAPRKAPSPPHRPPTPGKRRSPRRRGRARR